MTGRAPGLPGRRYSVRKIIRFPDLESQKRGFNDPDVDFFLAMIRDGVGGSYGFAIFVVRRKNNMATFAAALHGVNVEAAKALCELAKGNWPDFFSAGHNNLSGKSYR